MACATRISFSVNYIHNFCFLNFRNVKKKKKKFQEAFLYFIILIPRHEKQASKFFVIFSQFRKNLMIKLQYFTDKKFNNKKIIKK